MVSNSRKFLIYTPSSMRHKKRLRIVSKAALKVAEKLGFDIEVTKTSKVLSPYVFYLDGNKEKVPVYCDMGKNWNEEKIYDSIRSIVYALSFLQEYNNLQPIRKV